MQVGKPRAIGVDLEQRSIARTAAFISRPIESVIRQNHTAIRPSSVIVRRIAGTRGCRETMQRRERLRPHPARSEEHTSELQSQSNLVCRLLLEKKKKKYIKYCDHHSSRHDTSAILC